MVCGGGEAGPWSSSPQRSGWVPISPAEGGRYSPTCPPLGSISPQQPSVVATGSVSPRAGEVVGGSSARPIAPSPSSPPHAQSP
jgi:hypothetical protein